MKFKERLNPKTDVKYTPSLIPSVEIEAQALAKMWAFVDECPDEIGWLCTATRSKNRITIQDTLLFDQEVHATTTEITPEGLSSFAEELLAQPNGMDIWNSIKVWGHSHVRMPINPSAQDDSQMNTFKDSGHDWFVRIIANKHGELKVDVYDYFSGINYLDVPWEMMIDNEKAAQQEEIESLISQLYHQLEAIKAESVSIDKAPILEEMATKVRKKTYGYYQGGNYHTQGKQMRWDAEKAMMVPYETPTYRSNLHGNGNNGSIHTEITTDVDLKKNPNQSNVENQGENVTYLRGGREIDLIEEDLDIYTYFNKSELYELSFCSNISTLEEALYDQYYSRSFFSTKDLVKIFKEAEKVFIEMHNEENKDKLGGNR